MAATEGRGTGSAEHPFAESGGLAPVRVSSVFRIQLLSPLLVSLALHWWRACLSWCWAGGRGDIFSKAPTGCASILRESRSTTQIPPYNISPPALNSGPGPRFPFPGYILLAIYLEISRSRLWEANRRRPPLFCLIFGRKQNIVEGTKHFGGWEFELSLRKYLLYSLELLRCSIYRPGLRASGWTLGWQEDLHRLEKLT